MAVPFLNFTDTGMLKPDIRLSADTLIQAFRFLLWKLAHFNRIFKDVFVALYGKFKQIRQFVTRLLVSRNSSFAGNGFNMFVSLSIVNDRMNSCFVRWNNHLCIGLFT